MPRGVKHVCYVGFYFLLCPSSSLSQVRGRGGSPQQAIATPCLSPRQSTLVLPTPHDAMSRTSSLPHTLEPDRHFPTPFAFKTIPHSL